MRRLGPALAAAALAAAGGAQPAAAGAVAADPETPAAAHAAAHAHAAQRDRARWTQADARDRRRRARRLVRDTRAINATLAGRARDDVGVWEPGARALPDWAINAVLLPTGKILFWGREPLNTADADPGNDHIRVNAGSAHLLDPYARPGEPVLRHVPPPPVAASDGRPAPIFCAGQTLLSDGRVLLAGGNLGGPDSEGPHQHQHYAGLDYTFIFDPWTERWEIGPRMQHGRWYPTLVRLSSGDVVIAGGFDENGMGAINSQLEIYRPGARVGERLQAFPAGERGQPGLVPPLSLYPNMFLMPDGDVALAGPGRDDSAILDTDLVQDRTAPRYSAWTELWSAGERPSRDHHGGSPVIEPRLDAYAGSWDVLVSGGADGQGSGNHRARATAERFAAGPGAPRWAAHDERDDLRQARFYLTNVLLPDGGIVAVGGGLGTEFTGRPGDSGNYYVGGDAAPPELKQVELRRPGERGWRLGAAQVDYRTYHSTALLLPDGRVWSAGDDGHLKSTGGRDSAEVYWPPYLFDGDACAPRPAIRDVGATSDAGTVLTYGEGAGIFTEHAADGMRAVLVAPAAVTHGIDMNQRLVPLRVTSTVAGGGLNVLTPPHERVAPPGYYLLFVVDGAGTPSVAHWVRLAPAAEAAALRPRPPALVTARWPNPRPAACVDPPAADAPAVAPPPSPAAPAPAAPAAPAQPAPVAPAAAPAAGAAPAKLAILRLAVIRAARRIDLLASITAAASGRVRVELHAAGRRTAMSAAVEPERRRVRLRGAIPARQARLGTGIVTIAYGGNAATRPQSVRLRAAPRPARLTAARPTLGADGRLRAHGTIDRRARGVVRVRLQFEHGGRTRTIERRARIVAGRYRLEAALGPALRAAIAGRAGTLHSYTLFTGYMPARMRGELRSMQVLPARRR